ncbi:MAG: hypothetical protein ABSD88_16205 [Candidatus Korobacteraceae bacterium]|jgi:hypothetical protein
MIKESTTSATATAVRKELLKSLVASGEASYKESTRITSVLDDKAQKASALAGIFLAAGFAALRPDTISKLSYVALALLSAAILLLLLSVAFGLAVMWARTNAEPLSVSHVLSMVDDLLRIPAHEVTDAREGNFYRDQGRIWNECVRWQDENNRKKARLLQYSQLFLALAMGCVGLCLLDLLAMKFIRP